MICIHCGCTEDNACLLRVAEQDERLQTLVRALARRHGTAVPEVIGCSWFETDPPVCSAPACVAKHTEQLVKTLSP
jgi:hypothetical protein